MTRSSGIWLIINNSTNLEGLKMLNMSGLPKKML